ncbi:MAG: efflux RND transporter periplasmic adaptor subunit [Bacteroidales bacterium]
MKIKYTFIWMFIALFSLGGCNGRKITEKATVNPIPVNIQKVQYLSANKIISVSGNIEGNKTVRLGFLVAGKINFIAADKGETIEKGQLLASLDPESYSIAKEIADAKLDQTQDDFNRLSELYGRKSISESDYIKIINSLRVARAEQRLHTKNLEDTKLYSPIKGVLLKKGVEEGEIIDNGLQLFAVSDIYTIKVNASVPESELRNIKIGNPAKVFVASLDSNFVGRIVEIGTLAEATTRTFPVKIELNNSNLPLRPGMTAEIKIETGNKSHFIAVPAGSVIHDLDNSSFVYVVDKTKNQAFKRIVALGRIEGNNIEITMGLFDNDLVVIAGQNKLNNGSPITIKQ